MSVDIAGRVSSGELTRKVKGQSLRVDYSSFVFESQDRGWNNFREAFAFSNLVLSSRVRTESHFVSFLNPSVTSPSMARYVSPVGF